MSSNHIHISHLGKYVLTHRMYDAYLMTQLALNGYFTTSEIHDINCCLMSKGILFISNMCNHQGTHIHKSAANADTTFNMIHDFN